jgi:hippurate hydrolase
MSRLFSSFLLLISFSSASATVDEAILKSLHGLKIFYKDLHENPELSGQEKRTAEKLATEFTKLGLEVHTKLGGNGIAAVLRNGPGPTTWLRAELDGLPVTEETNSLFKSKVPGQMHACGHDFHMTALLGTAQVLIKNKDLWKGTVVFIGQPAEETVKGAAGMLKDGLLTKVPAPTQLLALHTTANLKIGTVGITPGFALANVNSVNVTFRGRGTHGSQPERGVDPFIEVAEFTLKLQTLLGREKKAREPAVISVGSIHGGTKHNIIPDEVKMQVTVRTYDATLRTYLKRRILELAQGIARTNNAPEPMVEFLEGSDATFNDVALSARVKAAFQKALGKKAVVDSEPIMGSEDFGQFGNVAKAPSLLFWVGEQMSKDPDVANHSPKYLPDFDKTAPLAIEASVAAVIDLHQPAK